MTTEAIARYVPEEVAVARRPLTVAEVLGQVKLVQDVMKHVMKKDLHYGTVPGTPKPMLYKAGAELLMSVFRLQGDPEVIDLCTPDEVHYRIKYRIVSILTGDTWGFGVGEASSNEEKYKWQAAVCDEEFDATSPERRRIDWKKGKYDPALGRRGPAEQVKQVRIEPADIANTVLKMAKKRAQSDGVLTATSASDIFGQDLDDVSTKLAEHLAAEENPGAPTKPDVEMPKRKSETAAATPETKPVNGETKTPGGETAPPADPAKPSGDGFLPPEVPGHRVVSWGVKKEGVTNGKPWKIYFIEIEGVGVATTFDTEHVGVAQDAQKHGTGVHVETKTGKYGPEIVSISPALPE